MLRASKPWTRASLRSDLVDMGICPGDTVIVHAAMRRVGHLLNGPDALIGALLDAVCSQGTVVAYCDWDGAYDGLLDGEGRLPHEWRGHVPPFSAAVSRAARDNGVLAEFIRTTPGAMRSGNPGASVAALGAKAGWLIEDHPLSYGYGPGSPFAKLIAAGGKVLMVGAPWSTMTILHHAEHLACIPNKRVRRYEAPIATAEGVDWRMIEEFDTSQPIVANLPGDYFDDVVRAFVERYCPKRGHIGAAPSLLVDAATICAFAVDWLEARIREDPLPRAESEAAPSEVPLMGGRVTRNVVRKGDTVRRPPTNNSEFVRALLRHLHASGFTGAPRALAPDERGRDVFSYIEGDVPVDLDWHDDTVVTSAARLIRRYHDATTSFAGSPAALDAGISVICHNDLSPCNFVFQGGMPVALIDFDAAAPGSRLYDLGYAAWLWLNLGDAEIAPREQRRRLELFAHAYDSNFELTALIDAVRLRQRILLSHGERIGDRGMVQWAADCLAWTTQHLS